MVSLPTLGLFMLAALALLSSPGPNMAFVLAQAVERHVAFVPGAPFFAGEADVRTLRLSFVTASVDEIDTAIAALASTLREQLAHDAAAKVQRELAAT